MKKLNKMLLREIKKSKGQFIAAAAVIFAGIVMFSASYMSYQNLKNSVDYYYQQYRFLDYYAEAQNITPEVIRKVKRLNGVKDAIGRISVDVAADMVSDRRVTVRLISLPDHEPPSINNIYFISGRYFSQRLQNVCLVDQKFAEFYKLERGDSISAIINLKTHELKVDGIVASPEFIYAMKSTASVSPSAEDFGVIYVKESAARSILGYGDAYNQLHVTFQQDMDHGKLIDEIEDILAPYGFIRGTERKDQLSYVFVDNEINELEEIAVMFPMLFLSVAAMIIYIMQRRIISNQRTLIGVMKAFGYTNRRILWHYILYSVLIGLAGAVPAVFTGLLVGRVMTGLYNKIFNIPVMHITIYWDILFIGIGLSMGFCLVAGYHSAKRVLKIHPAQAMRSEVPRAGKRIFLERIKWLWNGITFGWKMSIRNIFRSRQRTMLTIFGISCTIMFFMISLFFMDCVNYIFAKHFFEFQTQDYKVVFAQPASYYDAHELKNIEGIKKSEPLLEVPIELKNGWRKEETTLIGVVDHNFFYHLIDVQRESMDMPESGLVVSHGMADKLSIKPGDMVTIKTYEGTTKEKDVKVVGLTKQYISFNCFMNIEALGDLMGEGKFATHALIKIDPGMGSKVVKELFKIPGIETVEGRLAAYEGFMEFLDLLYVFVGLMITFGAIMGFAIIFNTTVINIMERRRELASLKVLGYTHREIESTIFRENMLLGFVALPIGTVLGRWMCEMLGRHFSNEIFTLEVIIYGKTYLITFISVFIFIILAQWANRKNISGLDMVEVLKNREN
ncbi:FtsX-like permease family protein [Petroclostridium sp. X23]|uniref:ABC transporter permease n=1 Tax=Petroclostridium sp. X23 TaxID=3045146 RepID=UPI0024AD0798|nr:FtsX-like permease family protein [Petroclostridium sp. X23]WHH57444.1 FtsX-like permease family protein [Petroclostridium sp. X23]